jgi:glycosyltransferase involved in cell wall biosynthesis
VREAIATQDPTLGRRTVVLRNGADLSGYRDLSGMRDATRQVLGYRPGTFVVGAVARLDPRKGLDVLLEAVSEALHRVPGIEVLIVGDGAERARLIEQSQTLGLHTRVRFVGEQSDVRPYLAAFDLFAGRRRAARGSASRSWRRSPPASRSRARGSVASPRCSRTAHPAGSWSPR